MHCGNDRRSREASAGWALGDTGCADRNKSGQAGWLFVQRHIRQHMPTRPGIIVPAVLFASWADIGLALVVMRGLLLIMTRYVKTPEHQHPGRNVAWMTTSRIVDGFILTDEKDASRYTLMRSGRLVSVLDYRDDGQTIALTRAFTVPSFRGSGFAGKVVEGAVADIEERGNRTVDAVCWYVADWFAAHPEHAPLLRSR